MDWDRSGLIVVVTSFDLTVATASSCLLPPRPCLSFPVPSHLFFFLVFVFLLLNCISVYICIWLCAAVCYLQTLRPSMKNGLLQVKICYSGKLCRGETSPKKKCFVPLGQRPPSMELLAFCAAEQHAIDWPAVLLLWPHKCFVFAATRPDFAPISTFQQWRWWWVQKWPLSALPQIEKQQTERDERTSRECGKCLFFVQ